MTSLPPHLLSTGGTPNTSLPPHLLSTTGTPLPSHLLSTGGTPNPNPSLPSHLLSTGGTPLPSHLLSTNNPINWVMTEETKVKFKHFFKEIPKSNPQHVNGSEAVHYFSQSGLAMTELSKVWTLSDRDKDNFLDIDEFCLASFLCSILMSNPNFTLPDSLPIALINSYKSTSPINWAVPVDAKTKYENYFTIVDSGKKGLISGSTARNLFLASRLADADLSAIWRLSDINQDGCLDKLEFTIAMHLIDCKRKFGEIPPTLPKIVLDSLMSPQDISKQKEEQQLMLTKEEIIKKLNQKAQLIAKLKEYQLGNIETSKKCSLLTQENEKLEQALREMEIISERQQIRILCHTEKLNQLKTKLAHIQEARLGFQSLMLKKKQACAMDEAHLGKLNGQLKEEKKSVDGESERIVALKSELMLLRQQQELLEKAEKAEKEVEKPQIETEEYYSLYIDDFATRTDGKPKYTSTAFSGPTDRKFFEESFYDVPDFSKQFSVSFVPTDGLAGVTGSTGTSEAEIKEGDDKSADFNPFADSLDDI